MARYDFGGTKVLLVLVQYPTSRAAEAGLVALQESPPEYLVVAEARGPLLGAVFGSINTSVATALLTDSLR